MKERLFPQLPEVEIKKEESKHYSIYVQYELLGPILH